MGRLDVKVMPGSSHNQIVGWLGDALKIKVSATREQDKANGLVVELIPKEPERIRLTCSAGSVYQVVATADLDTL